MLALLVAAVLLVTGGGSTARGQDAKATRFVCTSIPLDADPTCPVPPVPVPVSTPHEQDLRSTVMHLRETILQQKETMGNQKETIKELTSKLTRCESAQLEAKYKGSRRKQHDKANGKDTMGDLPRDHSEVVDHLGRTIQALKDRLGSLEQQTRPNLSNHAFPSDLREQLQRKLGDLESQLLNKVSELEDEKYILLNETAAHRYKTESALNALHERVTELEKESSGFKSPDDFKVSLHLRTNYLFARIKKSLPEMYAFTVCMWIQSRALSGVGTPFSYAVPGQANEIVLIEWANNPIELLINDKVAQLPMNINDGKWHHICITWTTRDGMWEAYQDGQLRGTGENLAPWHPIKAGGVLILGQEQDTVGGRFDATQAFVGELSHFNIWDRILTSDDIRSMANCSANLAGNIIPWIDNNVVVFGGATKLPLENCQERLLRFAVNGEVLTISIDLEKCCPQRSSNLCGVDFTFPDVTLNLAPSQGDCPVSSNTDVIKQIASSPKTLTNHQHLIQKTILHLRAETICSEGPFEQETLADLSSSRTHPSHLQSLLGQGAEVNYNIPSQCLLCHQQIPPSFSSERSIFWSLRK